MSLRVAVSLKIKALFHFRKSSLTKAVARCGASCPSIPSIAEAMKQVEEHFPFPHLALVRLKYSKLQ